MMDFRLANDGDTSDILEMFQAAFGKKFSPQWWAWYNKSPHGPNRYYIATDEGRLAGGYGLLPIKVFLNGQPEDASLCQNVCTHPDYQGRGLFVELGKYALAEESKYSRFSLGMPNYKAIRGHEKVGWDVATPLTFLYKPRPERHEHNCFTNTFFGPDVELTSQTGLDYSLLVSKSWKWLNWRYLMRPGYWNKVFVHNQNGNAFGPVDGYCIVKWYQDKAHILDIQAQDEEAFTQLIYAAEDFSSSQVELSLWSNPQALKRDRDILFSMGYLERASLDRLIIHTNYGEKVQLDSGPINFCLGDNDVY